MKEEKRDLDPKCNRTEAGCGREAILESRRFGEMSVLCVDDIKANVLVLRHLLKAMGVSDVRVAQSGPAALEQVEERAPDVIITDLWMPEMNGIEFANAVVSVRRIPEIRIIALTADMEAAKKGGGMEVFEQVLEKPVTIGKICQALCRPLYLPHDQRDV